MKTKNELQYVIGIDGGGTKTQFTLASSEGEVLATCILGTCNYHVIGLDGFRALIQEGTNAVLQQAKIVFAALSGVCAGIPFYGEEFEWEKQSYAIMKEVFPDIPVKCVNDVEVGAAGSLALAAGVHLLAGTGALAFARNSQGDARRVGGWSEFFSDEASCYWMGRKTLEIFSKEYDGRYPRGPLYDILMETLQLQDGIEIIDYYFKHLEGNRSAIARLQIALEKAAAAGDAEAIKAYEQAADELFLCAKALCEQLGLESLREDVKVSYSGGLFKSGDLILQPLQERLDTLHLELSPPLLEPDLGAVLLGFEYLCREHKRLDETSLQGIVSRMVG